MKKIRKVTHSNALDFLNTALENPRAKFSIKSMALSKYIEKFKNSENFKQKEIADNLEMAESQLSKWLSGFHNLTLQSILKLESASSIEILNPAIWNGTSLEKNKEISTTIEISNSLKATPVMGCQDYNRIVEGNLFTAYVNPSGATTVNTSTKITESTAA